MSVLARNVTNHTAASNAEAFQLSESTIDAIEPTSESFVTTPNGAPLSHCECGRPEDVQGSSDALAPNERLLRFPSLLRRSTLLSGEAKTRYNPLEFYADVQLTPIKISKGVYQVLSSAPGLSATDFQWKYSIVRDGKSPTWSLLNIGVTFESTVPLLRPVACLDTHGANFKASECVITDLRTLWEARSFKLVHFYDSWKQGGTHIGFQPDYDYRYEWESVELPIGSGNYCLYLWRVSISDPKSVSPAARIVSQNLIQDPIKPFKSNKSQLWSLEVDVDRIAPHIAILSAFSIKECHNLWHSWFAPKWAVITPPMPLINFAFQDEGKVYQRQEQFWADCETEDTAQTEGIRDVLIIPVFNKSYLEQFVIPPQALEMLNTEARHRKDVLEMTLAIRG